MATASERLRISRFHTDDREAVFLVVGTKAIALCEREGFLKVAPARTLGLFEDMDRRRRREVREFVSRMRLAPLALDGMTDAQLLDVVRGHIRNGRLVGVRPGGEASQKAGNETAERRRLIRQIENSARGRLSLAGRRYKLVADVDLGKISSRSEYEVVRHDDAVQVLAHLAAQPGAADLPPLLRQASAQLTRDWRPPITQPDGLILLRHVPVVAADGVEKPSITPSQMAKLLADERSVTLEVVVLDFDDKPLAGIAYVIEAPDGETYDGDLGPSAKTKITSAKKGTAGVTLKWAEAEANA
jgi:hypothetical protein